MVTIVRRDGSVENKGESINEFQARQTIKRIERRGLSRGEKRRGFTKETAIKSLQQLTADASRKRAEDLSKAIRTNQNLQTAVKSIKSNLALIDSGRIGRVVNNRTIRSFVSSKMSKPTQSLKVFTGIPSGERLTGLFGKKKTIPRKEEVTFVPFEPINVPKVVSLQEKFAKNGDIETAKLIGKLRTKGQLNASNIKKFEKKLQKQEEAKVKIKAINKKIQKFNDNYNKSVEPILNFLLPEKIANKKAQELAKDRKFARDVFRRVLREGSKIANPIIVGTEIGGFLETFRIAKNSGLTSVPKVLGKLKDPKKVVSDLSKFAKSSFNPKTVEGLSNIIIALTILGLPRTIIKGVARNGGKLLKTTTGQVGKGGKVFINELRNTVKQLASSKRASLRGGKRVKARPSKVEIRKRNLAKQVNSLTRQQKKGFARTKGETKRFRQQARTQLQQQKGVGKPLISVTIEPKARRLKRGKVLSDKAKKLLGDNKIKPNMVKQKANRIVVLDSKGNVAFDVRRKFGKITGREIAKPVKNSVKNSHAGIGNTITKQINKQTKRQKRRAKSRLKADKGELSRRQKRKLEIESRKKTKVDNKQTQKNIERRVSNNILSDKVSKPSVIYEEAFVSPPEFASKGWRSAEIKNAIINDLNQLKKSLEAKKILEAKKVLQKIRRSKIAKQVWKTRREVERNSLRIFKELIKPKINTSLLFKALTDVRIGRLIDDSLTIISLLRLGIININSIKRDVRIIPVAKPKEDVALSLSPVSVRVKKTKVIKPKKSKPLTKKRGKARKPRRITKPKTIVKKVLPPKKVRRVRIPKPIKKPKVVKKRRVLFRLPSRKNKRFVRFIKTILSKIPSRFRPSLIAVFEELFAKKKPKFITGAEVRRIILKLAKKNKAKGGKKNGFNRRIKRKA